MPYIPGTVVNSGLSPGNALNTHETHRAFYGKGGYRTVATLIERNQITPLRREEGMLVYVVSAGLIYILKPGAPLTGNTADANWDLLETGGGGGGALPITGTIPASSFLDMVIGQTSSFKISKYLASLTTSTKSFGEEIIISKDHTELVLPGFSKIEYALLGTIDAIFTLLINGADLVLRITNNELDTLTYTLINDLGSSIAATTTVMGSVELATDAETQAGVDTVRAITPANLSSRTSTEVMTGIAELATLIETNMGVDDARIVTPLKLKGSFNARKVFSGSLGLIASTPVDITHNFTTNGYVTDFNDVRVSVRDASTNEEIGVSVITAVDKITLESNVNITVDVAITAI